MIKTIDFNIKQCQSMKTYPKDLYYIGDISLLNKPMVSIVGSRKPNQYARNIIAEISHKLSQLGVCVVSGGAMGIDAIAHENSKPNTIMIAGTGLDKRYPAVNKKLIQNLEENSLVISQFQAGTPSTRYNFPLRNELIVALGDMLIVAYADINSGTTRSIEYALKMGKKIYVLAHRIGESEATNELLRQAKANAIYNVDEFVSQFGNLNTNNTNDEFLEYCKNNPTYDEAVIKYKEKVFEYELLGNIKVTNGKLYLNQNYDKI